MSYFPAAFRRTFVDGGREEHASMKRKSIESLNWQPLGINSNAALRQAMAHRTLTGGIIRLMLGLRQLRDGTSISDPCRPLEDVAAFQSVVFTAAMLEISKNTWPFAF